MKKIAVISMDVEEWYHLDYIDVPFGPKTASSLGGVTAFCEILRNQQIRGTFFLLAELVENALPFLKAVRQDGHELALHGLDHQKPLAMNTSKFLKDTAKAVRRIREATGVEVRGYRASCFSLDRKRLDLLENELDFCYDASRMNFDRHPLYGSIDMKGFSETPDCVFRRGEFFEFEMPSFRIGKRRLPISGGGYLRILPWFLIKRLIGIYIRNSSFFAIYVHPFEMDNREPPSVSSMGPLTTLRYRYNIKRMPIKLDNLITLLKDEGFEFMTYAQARQYYLSVNKSL